MLKDDEIRLRHMLEAAREAALFVRGRVREDLETDRQLVLALVKDIEIVGEAAAQITEDTRLRTPSIPWQQIISMRNRLVHADFSINLDIVWETVKKDLSSLIEMLEGVVPQE